MNNPNEQFYKEVLEDIDAFWRWVDRNEGTNVTEMVKVEYNKSPDKHPYDILQCLLSQTRQIDLSKDNFKFPKFSY